MPKVLTQVIQYRRYAEQWTADIWASVQTAEFHSILNHGHVTSQSPQCRDAIKFPAFQQLWQVHLVKLKSRDKNKPVD